MCSRNALDSVFTSALHIHMRYLPSGRVIFEFQGTLLAARYVRRTARAFTLNMVFTYTRRLKEGSDRDVRGHEDGRAGSFSRFFARERRLGSSAWTYADTSAQTYKCPFVHTRFCMGFHLCLCVCMCVFVSRPKRDTGRDDDNVLSGLRMLLLTSRKTTTQSRRT